MSSRLLKNIRDNEWWQGSIISSARLNVGTGEYTPDDFWIVSSQTCNLYNECFEKVPVFEAIAAKKIAAPNPSFTKGDNPRTLHAKARFENELVYFHIDIQRRIWLPREKLSEVGKPDYNLIDESKELNPDWLKNQWLDTFAGWMGRSYTRVALPDDFNYILQHSRIKDVLHSKITKSADKLYGIFICVSPDNDESWNGVLGLMPPPYLLDIKLVTYNGENPDALKEELIKQIFETKIEDGKDEKGQTKLSSRAEIARRLGIRIIKEGISSVTTSQIYLDELKDLIRYSMIDHLSTTSTTPL